MLPTPTLSFTVKSELSNILQLHRLTCTASGTRFLVHRANLAAGSAVFAGMFDSVSEASARPVIVMEEEADTLDLMLSFFYPRKRARLEIELQDVRKHYDMDADLPLLSALDKYEVSQPPSLGVQS